MVKISYPLILAVDFDGTVKKSKNFKEYGELQPHCKEVLIFFSKSRM